MKSKLLPATTLAYTVFLVALGSASLSRAAVWTYTNQTSTAWSAPANWNPNGGPTLGVTNFPGRANINASVIYDSPLTTGLGTLNTASPEFGRALVIGNGNGATGAVEITSGTLVAFQAILNEPVLVGAAGGPTQGPNQAALTLNGGHLTIIATNYGMLGIAYRGTNTCSGTLTVGNGSTLSVDRISFGGITAGAAQIGAGLSGTMNLNTGGNVIVRNIRSMDFAEMRATNNFNGGTLTLKGEEEGGSELIGPAIVNNLLAGGLVLDSAGYTGRVHSALLNGTGDTDGGLVKNGAGAINITLGGSTYTGPTVVNAGSLGITLPMASTSLSMAPGTALAVTVSNSTWSPSTITLTNQILNFAFGQVGGSLPAAIITVGTLNAGGSNVINITSGASVPTTQPIVLIDYGGNKTGDGTFTLGTLAPGMAATLTDDGTKVVLNVTRSVQSLTWSAGTGNWVVDSGALNWNAGTAEYLEYPDGSGDIVRFDDSPGVPGVVTIPSDVHPLGMSVANATVAYTFSGPGRITGATGIEKSGAAKLTLAGDNTYEGLTTVRAGTLQVTAAGALGSTAARTEVASGATLTIGDTGFGTTVSGETVYIRGTGVGGARGALRGGAGAGPNIWDGPVIFGEDATRIGTEDFGSLTVNGPISEEATNNWVLLIRPGAGGTVTMAGTGHRYGPTRTYGNGDGSGVIKMGANNALPATELQHGPGPVDLNGFDLTIGGLSDNGGTGTMVNNGANPGVLTIDTRTNNFTALCALVASTDIGASTLGLTKLGSGRQTLTGVNTHTGPTLVNGGVLRVSGRFTASPITVNAGGELQGAGIIDSPITLNSGGILSPGNGAIGGLTNNSTTTMNAGSTNFFELNAATGASDYVESADAYYGGQLVVTNISATPLQVGQVFKLFGAFSSGDFDNATNVVIAGGATGTFNSSAGELTITSVPPPPSLQVAATTGSLQFSWTNANGIYRLQSQTNNLSVGISTNWLNYPGGVVSPITVPVNPANETVFFRLVAP